MFLGGTSPTIFEIIRAAEKCFYALGKDVIITSGLEGTHKLTSKHYQGTALDLRSRHLNDDEKRLILAALKHELGPDYDVLLEGKGTNQEHFHIEYDPQ